MPDYLQHGRRHSPGGSDPIPGIGGISWAYISQSGTTSCAATSTTTLSATAANFYTNDSAMFQAALNSGHEGIEILKTGHYYVTANVTSSTPQSAGSLYELQLAGGGSVANFFGGKRVARIPTSSINDESVVTADYLMTVSSLPVSAIVAQIVNSGSGAVTLGITGMFVYQLDTDTTALV